MMQTVRDRPETGIHRFFRCHRDRLPGGRRTWRAGQRRSRVAVLLLQAVLLSGLVAAPDLSEAQPVQMAPPSAMGQPAGDQPVAPLMNESPIQTKNLLQVIRDGGAMMLPIAVCSFLLLVFVFERAISLRRGRVIPGPFVRRFLEQLRENQLDRNTAWELCEENHSPVSQVFAAGVKKWGRPSVEIEQAIIDAGERVTTGLRKYLRLFNGICTISPMLGLLGTVLGMISSFNTIATSDAMGRPDRLASGIGEALLTTAAGLCVAIPALVTYLYFVSRVDQLILEIDGLSQEVVELIASDGWRKDSEDEKPKRRARAA